MSSLYIAECTGLAWVGTQGAQLAPFPPVAEQKLTISGTAALSAAFSTTTKVLRLQTDAICSFAVGNSSVVATASNARLPANATEYIAVAPGQYLSVISNT